MRLHRALPLVLVALLLTALTASPAAAHTELESVVPEDTGTVEDPPIEVVLTFTQPLADPEAAQIEVIDPAGDDLAAAPPVVEGNVVTLPLNLAVAEGVHEVRWVVIAQDGHRLEGTTTFTFDPPQAVATPPGAESPGPMPTPTATPATTPTPTPTATETGVLSPAPPSPDELGSEEVAATSGRSVPPAVGILLAALALAAVGAVVVLRVRRGDGLG